MLNSHGCFKASLTACIRRRQQAEKGECSQEGPKQVHPTGFPTELPFPWRGPETEIQGCYQGTHAQRGLLHKKHHHVQESVFLAVFTVTPARREAALCHQCDCWNDTQESLNQQNIVQLQKNTAASREVWIPRGWQLDTQGWSRLRSSSTWVSSGAARGLLNKKNY